MERATPKPTLSPMEVRYKDLDSLLFTNSDILRKENSCSEGGFEMGKALPACPQCGSAEVVKAGNIAQAVLVVLGAIGTINFMAPIVYGGAPSATDYIGPAFLISGIVWKIVAKKYRCKDCKKKF